MKKIAILGSTGSIGSQALDIARRSPDRFSVEVVSCSKRVKDLCGQIEEFHPSIAVVEREEDAAFLSGKYRDLEVLWGMDGLCQAASCDCDMVLNSLMGMRGLVPTMKAIEAGNDIAFANKETLVAGGALVMKAALEAGVKLLPVDSEHSAIFQCLEGSQGNPIERILLTASGGPFRGYTKEQLRTVTLEQALAHPKWNMGSKITVDSATMMNKGLEIIEAAWLFCVPQEKIQVVVHPQSIVHSMVEFEDHSVIAQMGLPDMRVPISYALTYPERVANDFEPLDFFTAGKNLTFEEPDMEVFSCMKMARDAFAKGDSYPVALNSANEVLVQLFLEKKINFIEIQNNIERILEIHDPVKAPGLVEILEIDEEVRRQTLNLALGIR